MEYSIKKLPRRRHMPPPATVRTLPKTTTSTTTTPTAVFSRLPRLQFGKRYELGKRVSLEVSFDLVAEHDKLSVQYRTGNGAWRTRKVSDPKKMEIDGVPETFHYHAYLPKLKAGEPFQYIVLMDDEVIFQADAKAPPRPDQRFSFAVTGDIGDGGRGERLTAACIHSEDPDVLLLAGDVVYEHGRVSELDDHFVSIYNADKASPATGAPLLRSRASASAVGNHDMGFPTDEQHLDLNKRPDLLSFFLFWRHPQNGPDLSAKKLIEFSGKKAKLERLLGMLGADFLTKANYSFDFGNVHCIVLDANKYMNWTTPDLYEWLRNDLESASKATWKIVVWHQPPFNSDSKYCKDERMSVISPLLEEHGVDLVFNGHCHFYERSFPIRVKLNGEPSTALNADGTVNGTAYLDKEFDGEVNRRPNGIIYVVTGAGGRPSDETHMPIEMPHAAKVVSEQNSYTMCDVNGNTLVLRQMGVLGQVLDRIVIEKGTASKARASKQSAA